MMVTKLKLAPRLLLDSWLIFVFVNSTEGVGTLARFAWKMGIKMVCLCYICTFSQTPSLYYRPAYIWDSSIIRAFVPPYKETFICTCGHLSFVFEQLVSEMLTLVYSMAVQCLWQAMVSVWSVIHTFDRARWCVSVMSATMARIKADVSSVVALVSLMLITVKNAQSLRRM